MPIFEFRCRSCGVKFERIVNSATATTTCKNCGSPEVDRLLSVFAVVGRSTSGGASENSPCATCGARERGLCEG
jgi:putative FmdB family regulatory protein